MRTLSRTASAGQLRYAYRSSENPYLIDGPIAQLVRAEDS